MKFPHDSVGTDDVSDQGAFETRCARRLTMERVEDAEVFPLADPLREPRLEMSDFPPPKYFQLASSRGRSGGQTWTVKFLRFSDSWLGTCTCCVRESTTSGMLLSVQAAFSSFHFSRTTKGTEYRFQVFEDFVPFRSDHGRNVTRHILNLVHFETKVRQSSKLFFELRNPEGEKIGLRSPPFAR